MPESQAPQESSFALPEELAGFTIVGSGVIGLLTAKALAEQGHEVTILSAQGKPSRLDIGSTSQLAIGQFLPWVPEAHQETILGNLSVQEVTDFSRAVYADLAKEPHETGVMAIRNLELVTSSNPWPQDLLAAMKTDQEKLTDPIGLTDPLGDIVDYDTALRFDTFSINARKTIPYLADRVEKLGVKFKQHKVSLDDLRDIDGVIINASGMGAAALDPTSVINEYKGHTFVIRPRPGHSLPSEALSVEDIVMMPREDGTAVCGALYIENPKRPVPEETEARELFARLGETFHKLAGMVDGLDPDLLDHAKVEVHSAGYRVEVEGQGIRIAPDPHNQKLLHAYGFGGLGWSVGPHFAQKIANMARAMHSAED